MLKEDQNSKGGSSPKNLKTIWLQLLAIRDQQFSDDINLVNLRNSFAALNERGQGSRECGYFECWQ